MESDPIEALLQAKKTPGIGGITPGAKYTPDLGNRVLSYPAREDAGTNS